MSLLLRHARRLWPWLLSPAVTLLIFGRLVVAPGALIVDGQRPGVDRATPPDAVAVGNDLTRLFLPHHARIAEAVAAHGRIPGWDPAGFGGRPLVGNPQAGLWYPPVWLAWRWWSPSALGWLTLAHLVWGACGVYTLARSQSLSRWPSAISSTLWCSSPYVLAQTFEGHYPHVWAASFAPWTFLAMGGRFRVWTVPALLALGVLTGHAQETYYLGLVLVVWMGVEAVRAKRLIPGAIELSLIGLISLGILAVEILPDLLMRKYVVAPFRPTAVDAARYHVGAINLAQLVSPPSLGGPADYRGADNYWESLLSIGWTPLVLVLAGAWHFRRRGAVQAWVTLALLTGLFAFGRYYVVFDVLFAVTPGMTSFRVPSRSLFLTSLGVAMLAGFGVQAIQTDRYQYALRNGFAFAGLLMVLLMAAGWILPVPDVFLGGIRTTMSDSRFRLAFTGTALACLWQRFRPGDRRVLALAVGLLATAEMACYGFALIQVAPAARFLGPDPVGRAILAHRTEGAFRIRARDPFYGDARAFAIGLEKTNLNDSFQIRRAADLYERLYPMFGSPMPDRYPERFRPEVQGAVMRRMNVAFTITDRDTPDLGWPEAASGEWDGRPYTIRRNPEPLPRAYVVPRAEIVADGPAVVDRFVDCDPRSAVLMTENPLRSEARQPFTPASYTSLQADRVEVRVVTKAPGYLVVADTWMPGWSATDGGAAVEILRGNRAQRVIALERPGDHRIVMTYTPPGLAMGKAITICSVIAWAAGLLVMVLGPKLRSVQAGLRMPDWGILPGRTGARNR